MKLRLLVRKGWDHPALKISGHGAVTEPHIFALPPNAPIPHGYEEIELLGVAKAKHWCSLCGCASPGHSTECPDNPNPRMTATEVVQSKCDHVVGTRHDHKVRENNQPLGHISAPFTFCPDCGVRL